jgi:flavin-dependent dehydrogenase
MGRIFSYDVREQGPADHNKLSPGWQETSCFRYLFMAQDRSSSYHSIVVGAGPGGLACATVLARAGKEVLLIERRQEVGPKVCAGGITWSGLCKVLPAELMERSFHRQHIFSPLQRLVLDSPVPVISTVDRKAMGQWMLEQAIAAGVVVKTGIRALAVNEKHLDTSAGRFTFRHLVGADGSTSLVRRFLGLASKRMSAGIHYLVQGDFRQMEWHLDQRLFRSGYAWIFPREGVASVGAYAGGPGIRPLELRQHLDLWAHRRGLDLSGSRLQAALINFDYQGWRFGNVFLIGDAAGLASGLTGEGIYPAIVSGEAVARTIIDHHFQAEQLERLIRKQQRHLRLLHLLRSGLACRLGAEAFVFALRTGLAGFDNLEMGVN